MQEFFIQQMQTKGVPVRLLRQAGLNAEGFQQAVRLDRVRDVMVIELLAVGERPLRQLHEIHGDARHGFPRLQPGIRERGGRGFTDDSGAADCGGEDETMVHGRILYRLNEADPGGARNRRRGL